MKKGLNGILTLLLAFVVHLSYAQEKTVSGTVTDDAGLPLLGVNVIEKGTNNGTQTDFDGNYSIKVEEGQSLVFSYVGFGTKEVVVGADNTMNVVMAEEAGALEEVVVVAYGQQRKEEITGSVTTLGDDEIGKVQAGSVVQGLTGKVPGVQIINQTGQPGDDPTVRFRGIGSINSSSSPLYVVDGVVFNGKLNSINPQDIKSMTFLKDASANALYGSRGANGVVIITTKKGDTDRVEVTVDSKIGVNTRAVPEYDIFSDPGLYYETWYDRWRLGLINTGVAPAEAAQTAASQIVSGGDYSLGYNNYDVADDNLIDPATGQINPNATLLYNDDWQDESFKTGVRRENYVSMKYNNDLLKTFFSAGNLKDEGYAINSGFERTTVRLTTDFTPTDWLEIGGGVNYAQTTQDSPLQGVGSNTISNLFGWARQVAPIYPVFGRDANGDIIRDADGAPVYDFGNGEGGSVGERPSFVANQNPVATNLLDIDENIFDNFSGRMNATVHFLEDFSFTYNFSADIFNGNITSFATPIGGDAQQVNGRITTRSNRGTTISNQQLLNWDKQFGDHSFSVLLGHESNEYNFRLLAGQVTETVIDDLPVLDNGVNIQYLNGYQKDYTVEGYFSRLTYNFDNKYFINGSFRRDGSSVFHPDNRWGNFYGVGGAWSAHKEDFLADADWLTILRLKASFGQQGNDAILYEDDRTVVGDLDNRNYYAYTDQYDIVNAGGNVPGVTFFQLGNEDLKWEASTNINAGFELGLFENRLNINAEYFERKVEDLLFFNPIAISEGVGSRPENIGDMENKGIEVSLSAELFRGEDFNWMFNLNGTHYKNEITRLPDEFIDDGLFRLQEGRSRYDYYMREFAGIDEENGDALWYVDELDADGNPTGERTTTEDHATATEYYVGKSAIPDVYGGFSTYLSYKGFSLNLGFAYQIGGYGFDGIYQNLLDATSPGNNLHKDVLNSWTPENPNAALPRVDVIEIDQSNTSDFFLVDASYLSLQDITLGYDFDPDVVEAIGLAGARIYATANNVYLWSEARDGYDPRLSITGNAVNEYSLVRSTSLGLTLKF
ncbi:SusC/RagA family TonB-linked outer membrane protein [Salegentibacter chungangensis]|uniref:SusC/RagA family TonB-linked outer membrane protein n=1 Tax=Salegentibacter chungangensis TaxID=1335724 RepID=A0ABW3NMB9_9FLAO